MRHLLISAAVLWPVAAAANPVDTTAGAVPSAASGSAEAQTVAIAIPALTPVIIEIGADVGSAISTPLERFPIRLAQPIVIGRHEVVPAGAVGEGEIVHAKKAGGVGMAGELVIAARWLDVGGRRLTLRSMRVGADGGPAGGGQSGVDTNGSVNTLIAASTLAAPVSLLGFFIKGKNIVVPAGTLATAKTASEFVVQESLQEP